MDRRSVIAVVVVVAVAVYAVSMLQIGRAQASVSVSKLYIDALGIYIPVVNVYGYAILYRGLSADSSKALIMTSKGVVSVDYNTGVVEERGLPSGFPVDPSNSRLYDMIGTSDLIAVSGDSYCDWYWVGYWETPFCISHGVKNPTIIEGAGGSVCVANSTYAWCFANLGYTSYAYSLSGVFRPVAITDPNDAYGFLFGSTQVYVRAVSNYVSKTVVFSDLGYPNPSADKIALFDHLIARGSAGGWASVLYMDKVSGSYFSRFSYSTDVWNLVVDVKYYPVVVDYDRYIDSPIVTVNGKYYALVTGFKGSDLYITVVNISNVFSVVSTYVLTSVNSASFAMSDDGSYYVLVVDTPSLQTASVTTTTSTVTATVTQTVTNTTTVTQIIPTTVTETATQTVTQTIPTTVTTTYTTAVPTTITSTVTVPTTVTTVETATQTVTVPTTVTQVQTETSTTSVTVTQTVTNTETITIPTTVTEAVTIPTTVTSTVGETTTVMSTVTATETVTNTETISIPTTVTQISTTVVPTTVVLTNTTTVYGSVTVTVVRFVLYPVTTTEYVTTTTTVRGFAFGYDVVFALIVVVLLALAIIPMLRRHH